MEYHGWPPFGDFVISNNLTIATIQINTMAIWGLLLQEICHISVMFAYLYKNKN